MDNRWQALIEAASLAPSPHNTQPWLVRAVSETVFQDDPLRLLRAVRLEDELGFRLAPLTEELVRGEAQLVTAAAAERVVAELERMSARGYRRLDEVGLLGALGGTLDDRLDAVDSPRYRLVAAFGDGVRRLPVSAETRRYASALLRAERPTDGSARSVHRFRRQTEPWASDALAFVGAPELNAALANARAADPDEPLLRGNELGIAPGPEVGRLLERIAEERAVGTITTREQALELVRRETTP